MKCLFTISDDLLILNSQISHQCYNYISLFNNLKDFSNYLYLSFYLGFEYLITNSNYTYQAEIGSISSDIKILQEKSMDMGLRLKNRKVWPFHINKL